MFFVAFKEGTFSIFTSFYVSGERKKENPFTNIGWEQRERETEKERMQQTTSTEAKDDSYPMYFISLSYTLSAVACTVLLRCRKNEGEQDHAAQEKG